MNISQNTFAARVQEMEADPTLQELATWIDTIKRERAGLQGKKDKTPAELVRLDIIWEQYFRVEKTYSKRIRELLDQ